MRYADLEIRVQKRDANGYPVELTLDGERTLGRGVLSPSIVPWVLSADSAADGERLFMLLFAADRLKEGWALARGTKPQRRLRLRIDPDAPELHAIPWELLRDPGDGKQPQDLAATDATPFSRYLESDLPHGLPVSQRPVKVLVVIANPTNLGDYDLDSINVAQEWELLQAAIVGRDIALTRLPVPCTPSALEAELKRNSYHVLHLVAHGAFNKQKDQAVLFLADDANQVQRVSFAEFSNMLARQLQDVDPTQDKRLRLVFLASCDTAKRDISDAFRGLAPVLIAAGVPAVLAMQERVPIATAQAFAGTFYRRLLAHGVVDLAANEARSHVITARLPGASIPVLLMRLKDGQLFERPKTLTKRRMLVASIVVAFAIVSAFLLARPTLVRSIQTQGAEALDAGQPDEAVKRFQRANWLMFGRDANVHFNLGNAYESVPNLVKAADEYLQAVTLDSANAAAYNNLGRLDIQYNKDPDSALARLRPTLKTTDDPKSQAVLHKNIGWAYLEKGQHRDALDEVQQAETILLTMDAGDWDIAVYLAETYHLMALALAGMGRDDAAQNAWQSSLGYALAVIDSPECSSPPGRQPSDCGKAKDWSNEAQENTASPADSPP